MFADWLSLLSYTIPDHLPRNSTAHNGRGPFTSAMKQENAPHDCPQVNLVGVFFSTEVPSSQMYLAFVNLTKQTKRKNNDHQKVQDTQAGLGLGFRILRPLPLNTSHTMLPGFSIWHLCRAHTLSALPLLRVKILSHANTQTCFLWAAEDLGCPNFLPVRNIATHYLHIALLCGHVPGKHPRE